MTSRDLLLSARDGHPLAATLYEPQAPNGVVVLIGSATTVARGFYHKFAGFLCAQGFVVATYDSRGIGGSIAADWKGRPATYSAWAEEDMAGVIDWLTRTYPSAGLTCVGHSASGAIFGLVPNNQKVQGLAAIAAPYAYWGHWEAGNAANRRRMWLLCHLLFPVVTPLLGHYPGWFFGSGRWPKGVALEWARWARHPDFFVDERGQALRRHFDGYLGKACFYSFSDDLNVAPPHAVAHVAKLFRQADVQVHYRDPQDYGLPAVGHFGFFRSAMQQTAWTELAQWLRGFCPVARQPRAEAMSQP